MKVPGTPALAALADEGPELLAQRPVQLRGSPLARACLGLAGWQVDFDGLPDLQGVIAVYPHTSNWDFVVGILAKWAIGLPVSFWGKDTLFRVPLFGRWLRWVGGVPVDRSVPRGVVAQTVRALCAARDEGRFMWLVVAPEGTRSRTAGWRSGFHQVAVRSAVPLGLAHIDYARRRIGLAAFYQLTGDPALDMRAVARHLDAVTGLRPSNASPVQLRKS